MSRDSGEHNGNLYSHAQPYIVCQQELSYIIVSRKEEVIQSEGDTFGSRESTRSSSQDQIVMGEEDRY